MFNLIKKDFLIVKRVWIGVMIFSLLVPIIASFAAENISVPSKIILPYMSILISLTLFLCIDEEEEKYPKAAAMITTVGYSRNIQVIKRYVLMLCLFLYSTIVYGVESMFISNLGSISLSDFIIALFFFILVTSVYLALSTLYGVRVGRYTLMTLIIVISLGPLFLSKLNIKLNFDFIKNMNEILLMILLILLSLIVFFTSLKISINSYMKKEL